MAIRSYRPSRRTACPRSQCPSSDRSNASKVSVAAAGTPISASDGRAKATPLTPIFSSTVANNFDIE
eukprot:3367490-Lingulodinium_polyedra.AAC.1